MKRKSFFGLAASLLVAALLPPSAHAQQVVEGEILIAAGSTWDYLLYTTDDGGGVFTPVDPVVADPDFHTTWQRSTGYNGPTFLSGAAPLGYEAAGSTDLVIATDVWGARDTLPQPPSGQRNTVYFRQAFTPAADVTQVRVSGIVDDGAIFYLNGVRIGDTGNFDNTAIDEWNQTTNATGSETVAITFDIDAALDGGDPAEFAVSLHNTSATSSDLGQNLRLVALEELLPTPPPNDNFADAIAVDNATLPVSVAERANDGLTPRGASATLEAGEPVHPSGANKGSVWFSYTALESGPLRMNAAASSLNTMIAVYTGSRVNALTLVAAAADDVLFYPRANVFFNAVANRTYFISISSEDLGNDPLVDGEDFGTARVTVSVPDPSIFNEIALLLPAGSNWRYLLATETTDPALPNRPVDPSIGDPDFHTTWKTGVGYNGPAFQGPAPALLGYGAITADPIITDIWGARDTDGDPLTENLVPPTGLRYTTYFRTTFTPSAAVSHLGFRGIVDDAAEIFINGVRVSTINYFGPEDTWLGTAPTATGTEDAPQESVAVNVNLTAGVQVQIAVALHNNAPTSSDMGFDLEVYSIQEPSLDFGTPLAGSDPLVAGFDSSAPGAMAGAGDGGPEDNLPWTSTSGTVEAESGLPNPPTPAGNAIFVNNGRIDLVTGAVDLMGVNNAEVRATVDFRAFEDSDGSDFEAADTMVAYIEGSTDGVNFVRIADVMPVQTGGASDALKGLELANGAYTTFRSAMGAIPVGVETIRVVIAGVNNSDTERFFIDNVRIGTDLGPPPVFASGITRNLTTRQNTITWNTDDGFLYTLSYSRSDLAGWTPILTDSVLGTFNHTPPAGDREGFYRVERAAD